tara:strand:+ start:13391 stop:14188 length:798 start_codon:yes stop_codon:yes gene_type:complete
MYQSTFAEPLNKDDKTIKLALVGPPGSGKTYSALTTFPNPILVDLDNNLPTELQDKGYNTIKLWDEDWRKAKFGAKGARVLSSLIEFMTKEGRFFTEEQTLIFDSVSAINDHLEADVESDTPRQPEGDRNFRYWKAHQMWLSMFLQAVRALSCNVVVICHEDELRDPNTNMIKARRIQLPGKKTSPRLPSFFNNVFRQVRIALPVKKQPIIPAPKTGAKESEQYNIAYLWLIKPYDNFDIARTTIVTDKKMVMATYKSFGLDKPE